MPAGSASVRPMGWHIITHSVSSSRALAARGCMMSFSRWYRSPASPRNWIHSCEHRIDEYSRDIFAELFAESARLEERLDQHVDEADLAIDDGARERVLTPIHKRRDRQREVRLAVALPEELVCDAPRPLES